MFKKYITFVLTILVLSLSLNISIFAETKAEKEIKFAEKVRANITKLGTGKDAKVKVNLKDGTKLKGYISQINADSFVVVNEKTGDSDKVLYSNAKQVKGSNSRTAVYIAISIGIIIGVVILTNFLRNG